MTASWPRAEVNVMRQAMTAVDWTKQRPVTQALGYQIHARPELAYGAIWVDQAAHVIALSQQTWDTVNAYGPAILELLDMVRWAASGMRFLDMSQGAFATAVVTERRRLGDDVVAGKDAITDLNERLHRLLSQAASIMASGSPSELLTLMLAVSSAKADLEQLEERLAQLRSTLETVTRVVTS